MQKLIMSVPSEQAHWGDSPNPTISMSNIDTAFVGSVGAARLLTYDPTDVVRSTSGSCVILLDFGKVREFQLVSLLHTNISYRATLRVDLSNDGTTWISGTTKPFWPCFSSVPAVYTGGEALDPRRVSPERISSLEIYPTVQSYRYVRLVIADPINSVITAGRLFVGPIFSIGTGVQYGSSRDFSDSGNRERSQQGSVVLNPGRKIISESVKFDFLTKEEMQSFMYELNYWRGATRETLMVTDLDNTAYLPRNILYGSLTEGRRISSESFNAYSQTLILESL